MPLFDFTVLYALFECHEEQTTNHEVVKQENVPLGFAQDSLTYTLCSKLCSYLRAKCAQEATVSVRLRRVSLGLCANIAPFHVVWAYAFLCAAVTIIPAQGLCTGIKATDSLCDGRFEIARYIDRLKLASVYTGHAANLN